MKQYWGQGKAVRISRVSPDVGGFRIISIQEIVINF